MPPPATEEYPVRSASRPKVPTTHLRVTHQRRWLLVTHSSLNHKQLPDTLALFMENPRSITSQVVGQYLNQMKKDCDASSSSSAIRNGG